jgi:hypothetical protein
MKILKWVSTYLSYCVGLWLAKVTLKKINDKFKLDLNFEGSLYEIVQSKK